MQLAPPVTTTTQIPPPPDGLPCELVGELGRGATGIVWEAKLLQDLGDYPAGTRIAIKRAHASVAADPAQRSSFEQECRLVMDLNHPGLVGGVRSGADDLGPWLAMQLVPGPTLREQIEESGALPEPRVRACLERLSSALAHLHGGGHLHGDIKPENVRLDAQGRAVLMDFGFAQPIDSLAEDDEVRITGSLAYLSPEHRRGERPTTASEAYSLGILIYELATGTHPFGNVSTPAPGSDWNHPPSSSIPETASLRVPTLSPFMDRVLESLLEEDPKLRLTIQELQSISTQQEESSWWRKALDEPRGAVETNNRSTSALPLVGREKELEFLMDAARQAFALPQKEGEEDEPKAQGGVLELLGSSGSGKSRLMREFARRARMSTEPPLFLQSRCPRFEEQRPAGPVIQLLSRFLRLPHGTPPGERERAILDELLPSAERDTLIEVLEPAFDGTTTASVPLALCTWLTRLAERGPLVIHLDDLDFADQGTLEILTRLVRGFGGRPLLLVVGRDSQEVPHRPEAMREFEEVASQLETFQKLELPPLTEEAVRELTEALFLRSVPRLRLAQVLWKRSQGNPGLISELMRGLVDRGDAVATANGFQLRVHPDELPLPASLRDEILKAYARLDSRDRLWLSRLAVCGGRIQTRFLLRAWPKESASVLDETLGRLTRRGWLRTAGELYRFRRPALRAAIYKRLSETRKQTMHAAVAQALRPGPGGRQSLADAFQRAYHLRAAANYAELMQILRPMLKRLHDRGQPARVHTLGLWGLEALEHLSDVKAPVDTALEFYWAAVDAADRLGFREQQRVLLDKLSDLEVDFEQAPDQAGRIYLLHARHSISGGHYGAGRGMLANAIRYFETSKNKSLHSEALQRMAMVHAHTGQMEEGRKSARQALSIAPDEYSRARAELALGVLDMLEGKVESALKRSDRCLIDLRKSNVFESLAVRAMAHSLRARVYRAAGRPRRGLVSAQHALRFAKRAGHRRLEIELQARLGCHLLDIDRVEEAEELLRDALLQANEIEDRRGESLSTLFLGILLAEQNDPSGSQYLARCARVAREMGLTRTEAVCMAIQARISFQRGSTARALDLSTRAVGLLDQAGAELIDRIVIRGTHAMILEHQGRQAESDAQLEGLRRLMRAAGNRIESPLLHRRQRLATSQLLKAALSPDGPVYRRVQLDRV